jgi:hypothetical protein
VLIQQKLGRAHPHCCKSTPFVDGLAIVGVIGLGASVGRGARRAGFAAWRPEAYLFRALKGVQLGGSAGRAGSAVLMFRSSGGLGDALREEGVMRGLVWLSQIVRAPPPARLR